MPRRTRRHFCGATRANGHGNRASQGYSFSARRGEPRTIPPPPAPRGVVERARRWLRTGALAGIAHSLASLVRGSASNGDVEIGAHGAGLGLAAVLNALDWDNVRAEVDRESRAHAVLMGGRGAGKTTLLYRLKGFMPEEIREQDEMTVESEHDLSEPETQVENLGFFAVIDVPAASPNGAVNESSAILLELESADLVVWILDAEQGLRTWEYEWIQRVRAMGKSILVAANKMDVLETTDALLRWTRVLGCEILPIAAETGMNVETLLVPRLADASPGLATALGREITSWRRDASARAMRRAAVLSGLTGLEPIPLLDLPFQIFIQLQMVLRIAAIYGQPLTDRYSREMLATMVSAVALRMGGQQLIKVIPFVGWAASSALAAGGTWTIGRIAVEYFERGRKVWGGRTSDGREMERPSDGEKEGDVKGETKSENPEKTSEKRGWRLEIGDWRFSRWVGNVKRRFDLKWLRRDVREDSKETEGSDNDGATI